MTDTYQEEAVENLELHDDDINEVVEETLDERSEPKGDSGAAKASKDQEVSEPESIASVDKAADATAKTSLPKTKAGMLNSMYKKMEGMKKLDLQAMYKKMEGMQKEYAEEVESEESISEFNASQELDALVESEATLSDEFKAKTAVIFETAVRSKLTEEVDRLEEQYAENLEEEVSSVKEDLVEKVDSYLNYVVETWMEENQLAVQSGLRTEISEQFMEKMKDLFTESYIEVPETKVDLVDELAEQVDELETKLNEQTGDAIRLSEELEEYKRNAVIAEACRDLADTQVEKLKTMVENVDFEDQESFSSKVATIKESFFKSERSSVQESVIDEEPEQENVEVSSAMENYLNAIKKTAPRQ